MKAHYKKFVVMACPLLMLGFGLLYSTHKTLNVSAAATGGITGTIKLDGTPPHQKPIDMSKEPNCAKAHASNPVTTETVIVGPKGGLKWVVVYISEGLDAATASEVPPVKPTWDQKGCQYIPHVMRSEEHTSELQSPDHLVCRLLLEKKKASREAPGTKKVCSTFRT